MYGNGSEEISTEEEKDVMEVLEEEFLEIEVPCISIP